MYFFTSFWCCLFLKKIEVIDETLLRHKRNKVWIVLRFNASMRTKAYILFWNWWGPIYFENPNSRIVCFTWIWTQEAIYFLVSLNNYFEVAGISIWNCLNNLCNMQDSFWPGILNRSRFASVEWMAKGVYGMGSIFVEIQRHGSAIKTVSHDLIYSDNHHVTNFGWVEWKPAINYYVPLLILEIQIVTVGSSEKVCLDICW